MFRLPSYFDFRHTSTSLSMTNGLNVVPSGVEGRAKSRGVRSRGACEVEGRAWQSDNKT